MEKDDRFKIFIEQLRDGHVEKIDESFESSFLGVEEPDLRFKGNVAVKGEAYIAGDELVLHLAIQANSVVPCKVCNAPVDVQLDLPNVYEVVPLEEVPHGVFSMREILRQVILLDRVEFAECNEGNCPHRPEITPYMHKPSSASPFDQLREDDYKS